MAMSIVYGVCCHCSSAKDVSNGAGCVTKVAVEKRSVKICRTEINGQKLLSAVVAYKTYHVRIMTTSTQVSDPLH